MNGDNQTSVRWDRVALIGVFLIMAILLVAWIQYNFGVNTAAWVMAMIFTTVLIAAVALFVLRLYSSSQQNTAHLLHEFGNAQTSPYRMLEQQIRANRDMMRIESKTLQLESKAQSQDNDGWEFDEVESGPIYVD